MKKITAPDSPNPKSRQIEKKYLRLFEKLSKSEQEKSVILDAMTELVLYLDTDLRVIWANKAMHDASNLDPGQLNGKHCYHALHNGNQGHHFYKRRTHDKRNSKAVECVSKDSRSAP